MSERVTMIAPSVALLRREWIRFVRQPTRVVAAILTPALIWGVLGSGFAGSFAFRADAADGPVSYAAFLVPGMASMIALFSSIFAAISLIEDRQEGFLQAVLVSPASARAVIASKLAAATLLATVQSAVIVLAAPLVGLHLSIESFVLALGALLVIAVTFSAVSLACAWIINSVQGFHGIMNLVLMPMWLLSGSVFPVDTEATWLAAVMRLNPLSWPTSALRDALISTDPLATAPTGQWAPAAVAMVLSVCIPLVVIRPGGSK